MIGENRTFVGQEDYLKSQGVQLYYMDSEECVKMMGEFTKEHPELWHEDIGLQSVQVDRGQE